MEETEYLWLAAGTAVAAFFIWPCLPADSQKSLGLKTEDGDEGPLMWWGDALGIGCFSVVGAMNACRMCLSPSMAVLSGVSSSTFGGLTRDVICGLPGEGSLSRGRILHSKKELYATAAAAGSIAYMAARQMCLPVHMRILIGMASGVGVRWGASASGVGMPTWEQMDWRVQEKPTSLQRDGNGTIQFSEREAKILAQVISAVEKQKEADRRRAS